MPGLPAPDPGAVALVTGASAGIGEAVARELAARGHGVALVARREERLHDLADELGDEHGVVAEVLPADLTDPGARAGLAPALGDLGLRVDVLVNNAGFGTSGPFVESPVDREVRQVRILVEAVVDLTGRFAPGMAARGAGAILTVASTAGFAPLPRSAGYSAAKAHAVAFTEALHAELGPRGVSVTALCPGPVDTEFFDVSTAHPIETTFPRAVWVTAEECARAGVDGLAHGKRIVVPGLAFRAAATAAPYVPRWLQLRAFSRFYT